MKVRAMTAPEPVWIRFISDTGEAFVRLRQNVCLKADDEEHLEWTYYEWDEVEIRLVDRDNLLGYVQENFDELFAYGLAEENKPKPKTAKELRDEQIKALKDENLMLLDMLVTLYEMNGVV
ncbi:MULTISPECIES: hypothetical protein [unclassified Exiguobacterium]|uniref:hypothetical protein n=1 Tax=unclassified Exiguobacterium TaxID=2644629 RepID=UPI0025C330B4|nr:MULTISPECIES: hypothetical protein [unclassified Exiguobacterium]